MTYISRFRTLWPARPFPVYFLTYAPSPRAMLSDMMILSMILASRRTTARALTAACFAATTLNLPRFLILPRYLNADAHYRTSPTLCFATRLELNFDCQLRYFTHAWWREGPYASMATPPSLILTNTANGRLALVYTSLISSHAAIRCTASNKASAITSAHAIAADWCWCRLII